MRTFVFQTNPADYRGAIAWCAETSDAEQPTAVCAWTVPAKARPGDLFLLYGHKPVFAYGAIGRVCSEPVVGADGNQWATVEIAALPRPLALAEAKCDPVIRAWPRFKMMAGSHLEIVDRAVWRGFLARTADPHPNLRHMLMAWSDGAPMPPAEEGLEDAWRAHANHNRSGTCHERALQKEIREGFIGNGWARELRRTDGVAVPASFHLAGAGYADLILVDLETRRRQLLLIEVKRDAIPGPGTDGITQLLSYEVQLRRAAPRWAIKKMLVALTVAQSVLDQATTLDIECWYYDEETGDLLEP